MPVNKLPLNKLKTIIKSDYPDFSIKSVKTLKGGWDNFVIEINKTYIFRFPKRKDFVFDKEIKILKAINGRITLDVPVYEFIGRKVPYVGYKKIIGQPLSFNTLKSLGVKNRHILARDIANFFYEFHFALPVSRAGRFGLKKDINSWRPLVIKKKIIGRLKNKELSDFIEVILNKYSDSKKQDFNLVVAYNDLSGDNMAFNRKSGRIKGIFDFSDVAIEDVNREFCSLFSLDKAFTMDVIKRYEKRSGRIIDRERVFINAVISEASVLGVFIDKPDSKDYKRAFNSLRRLKLAVGQFSK